MIVTIFKLLEKILEFFFFKEFEQIDGLGNRESNIADILNCSSSRNPNCPNGLQGPDSIRDLKARAKKFRRPS